MTSKNLCLDLAKQLLLFTDEVFNYEFEEEPNYGKLKFLLVQTLLDFDLSPNFKMDWSKHSKKRSNSANR
jgi:hypothetical protein